jgi:branched-chain amino acid transport system ATP-binding protein
VSLILRGIVAGYGGTEVLRTVNVTVPEGRVVALLGPNGAGKSTLLRVASGLLPPARGRLELDGHDVTTARPSRLSALGLCHIPEGRAIFPSMTVAENLKLLGSAGQTDAVERACDAFPVLSNRLTQIAGTMSGGEQQMLALTRAYLTTQRYVLLDEVSMGLAPIVVDQIFEFLRRLADAGTALLIVEQYVAKALELADIVYVLARGDVSFCGEPGELDGDALAESYLGGSTDRSGSYL